jgi:hypothetical protein
MLIRGSSLAEISFKRSGLFLSADLAERTDWAAERAAIEPVSDATLNSLNVFHCPQAGHFPIHFADSCPQFEQTYIVLSLAISGFFLLCSLNGDVQRYYFFLDFERFFCGFTLNNLIAFVDMKKNKYLCTTH